MGVVVEHLVQFAPQPIVLGAAISTPVTGVVTPATSTVAGVPAWRSSHQPGSELAPLFVATAIHPVLVEQVEGWSRPLPPGLVTSGRVEQVTATKLLQAQAANEWIGDPVDTGHEGSVHSCHVTATRP